MTKTFNVRNPIGGVYSAQFPPRAFYGGYDPLASIHGTCRELLDLHDLSVYWKDSGKSSPATANSDLIYTIANRGVSGDFQQSTSGNRPTLYLDATDGVDEEGNVLPSLAFTRANSTYMTATSFVVPHQFVILAAMKLSSSANTRVLLGGANTTSLQLYFSSTHRPILDQTATTAVWGQGAATGVAAPISCDQWVTLAVMFDGTFLRWYEDGELLENLVATAATWTGGQTHLGATATPSNYFDGRIRGLRIYDVSGLTSKRWSVWQTEDGLRDLAAKCRIPCI